MPLNYRMDRLSGRIVGSSSKSAYSPKGFFPVEPIPVMKMSASEKAVPVRSIADMRTALEPPKKIAQTEILGKFPDNPTYRRLQEFQRIMSKPDGKLVWEKLPRDVFAFRFTVLLCAGGMALLANTYYKMAYGIKPES